MRGGVAVRNHPRSVADPDARDPPRGTAPHAEVSERRRREEQGPDRRAPRRARRRRARGRCCSRSCPTICATPLSVMMISASPLPGSRARRSLPAAPVPGHAQAQRRSPAQMLDSTSRRLIERGPSPPRSAEEAGSSSPRARRHPAPGAGSQDHLRAPGALDTPPILCDRGRWCASSPVLLARAVRTSSKSAVVAIHVEPDAEGGTRIAHRRRRASIPAISPSPSSSAAARRRRAAPRRRLFVLDLFVARGLVEAYGGRHRLEARPRARQHVRHRASPAQIFVRAPRLSSSRHEQPQQQRQPRPQGSLKNSSHLGIWPSSSRDFQHFRGDE